MAIFDVPSIYNERYKLAATVEHCAYDADPIYNNLW